MSDHSSDSPGQWLRDVRAMTSGPVRVHLSCDDGVDFPVEVVLDGHPGYVGPEMLGVSRELTDDLIAYQRWWEGDFGDLSDQGEYHGAPGPAAARPAGERLSARGARLVERLQDELGPDFVVSRV